MESFNCKWPDITVHFTILVERPLTEAYKNSSSCSFPVIVIDASDECNSDGSHWRELKNILMQWLSLPKKFKLIITSRDEPIPERFHLFRPETMSMTMQTTTSTVSSRNVLRGSEAHPALNSQARKFDALTARAAGFLYGQRRWWDS